ncbi:MAG TPA: Kiwa anti-phage protein KwaB-like domain-containing protein [Candidatus Saccharimonadales bacterium]|nr:Kiwa anti-phage protein KwaB-like domain-containing protein [Candidatus Saccharimonadales bacterium]
MDAEGSQDTKELESQEATVISETAPENSVEVAVPASVEAPVSAPASPSAGPAADDNYQETDVFAWANNLVQYKDELKIELFFISKNYVLYKTNLAEGLKKQLEPIFVDEMLEFILEGIDKGLIVRGFEQAEAEEHVLQRTQVKRVEKLVETLNWLKTQEHEIVAFKEEEHDINHMKGLLARVSHPEMKQPFYVAKVLPKSQVMKGRTGWMLRGDKFIPFDAEAALRLPTDPQLLVLDQDLYVFSQPKLKSLFGYDAKEQAIADSKIREIEEMYRLSFSEGMGIQSLVKDKKALVKKLQKLEVGKVTQEQILEQSEDLDLNLMNDDSGAIIIMDDKDITKFINLMNDDYMESPVTGERYEIIKKRLLKPDKEEDNPLAGLPPGV